MQVSLRFKGELDKELKDEPNFFFHVAVFTERVGFDEVVGMTRFSLTSRVVYV